MARALVPLAAALLPLAGAWQAPCAPALARSAVSSRRARPAMDGKPEGETIYEEYIRKRVESGEDIDSAYSDLGQDIDFDGGDSGSGAVGDGKMTLDDQHNSPYIIGSGSASDSVLGAATASSGGAAKFKVRKVEAAVNARDVKAKNYWGRQVGTGYADELVDDEKYADRPVLRQQLENWHNQQNLKSATDQAFEEQSSFFGQKAEDSATDWKKAKGRPIDSIRSEIRVENVGSAQRLDGQEWGPVTAEGAPIEDTFELKAMPNTVAVLDIEVENELSAFSPFRCEFTPDSPREMTVAPQVGVMEKRYSGHPTEVTVRFTPSAYGIPIIGKLVFETEDFKKVYEIVGKTAD